MLILHQSNRLELLAEILAEIHAEGNSDPFVAEQVVVQNAGMGRWLSRKLADHFGIAANLKFAFPAQFMWELLRHVLDGLPETAPFNRGPLAWRILAELESGSAYPELAQYLASMDSSGRFQLARQLENLFDHYLFYRPDWIESWQQGNERHWQARLWRRLRDATDARHWIDLQHDYIWRLAARAESLPSRILFFGIADLSPGYLRLMAETANQIDVHFFVVNPCRVHWQEIVPEKTLIAASAETAEYLEVGNPLLASMGRQGRDFFEQMLALEADDRDSRYHAPEADTLLGSIQRDILDAQDRGKSPTWRAPDDSIVVQSCHSAMREVEVLHDQLLAMFESEPDLRAEDIVVMTPSIGDYAPAIEAVFGAVPLEHRIPWSVADRSLLETTNAGRVLQALLDFPGSRYEVNRLLDLLDFPSVSGSVGLDEEALERIRDWCADLNIRWGIDGAMRATMDLPDTDEHSWRLGLRRLMLGYMLDRDSLFDGLLPYREVEGNVAVDMGRFVEFAERLFAMHVWREWKDTVGGWMRRFADQLESVLDADQAEQLVELRGALLQKSRQAELAGYGAEIDFKLARKLALDVLRGTPARGGFLAGGVTFCELIPMRSVPFRVVCLIGMDFGRFPRPQQRISFDLSAGHYRRGDRSPRLEDRYLFLESLLAARERLYLSFVGQDQHENEAIPPSVLVSELLDTIESGFGIKPEQLIQHQPLQAFSRRYLSDPTLFTYADHGLQASHRIAEPPFCDAPVMMIGEDNELDIDELERFIQRPVRYFLQQSLGLARDWLMADLEEREPFALERFVDGEIRRRLHEWADAPEKLEPYLRQQGLLPHGEPGTRELKIQTRELDRLMQRLPDFEYRQPQLLDVYLSGTRLRGQVDRLTEQGQLWVSYTKPYKHELLSLWLRHLLLSADSGVSASSRLIYPEGDIDLQPVTDAGEQLEQIVEAWREGRQRPIHFMPKSAYAWASNEHSARATKPPMVAAKLVWEARERPEANEEEYRIAFRGVDPFDEEFERLAKLIWGGFLDAGGKAP